MSTALPAATARTAATRSAYPEPATAVFSALGTTAVLLTADPALADDALLILRAELAAIDAACSRFRPDSELSRANTAAGNGPVPVSALLAEAVEVALRAAELTDGAVDPMVGPAVVALGYDRTFAEVAARRPENTEPATAPRPAAGWRSVRWDPTMRLLRLPAGTTLDLGATAKALAADRAARRAAAAVGCGVLVNLGGDLSAAGEPPAGGWRVAIADNHAGPEGGWRAGIADGHAAREGSGQAGITDDPTAPNAGAQAATADRRTALRAGPQPTITDHHAASNAAPRHPVVSIRDGGLATSGTTVRTWRRGGRTLHHIVDPATGDVPPPVWRTVSVAAGSCVDANTATTAALVLGERAPDWLRGTGLPARLVRVDGSVLRLGAWPAEGGPR
ncbi:FAD:protein FMN transferase [Streptomyces sp. MBT65]|uniref:FAD:protein FMN transferase n=1 Tax=Streptomyces sp. MBT65 TaxID=1488395 RepID=UPI0027DA03CE|nr:FAD:protein FMN transferase [Streptomyces sp. MBT65]